MDSDDTSLPARLERQVKFMEDNSNVGVCGSYVQTLGTYEQKREFPLDSSELKIELLFGCCISNHSAMIRNAFLKKYGLLYNHAYVPAEDYEFWVRCSRYFELSNIPEVLVHYRIHGNQFSSLYKIKQDNSVQAVREIQIKELGLLPTREELLLHEMVSWHIFKPDIEFLNAVDEWFIKLINANRETMRFPEPQFTNILAKKFFLYVIKLSNQVCYHGQLFIIHL